MGDRIQCVQVTERRSVGRTSFGVLGPVTVSPLSVTATATPTALMVPMSTVAQPVRFDTSQPVTIIELEYIIIGMVKWA